MYTGTPGRQGLCRSGRNLISDLQRSGRGRRGYQMRVSVLVASATFTLNFLLYADRSAAVLLRVCPQGCTFQLPSVSGRRSHPQMSEIPDTSAGTL